jgi:hypothetical protein
MDADYHPDDAAAAGPSSAKAMRCVTHRPKQNKYQSQVSINKSSEKAMLPPALARLTCLTGGFHSDPTDAARASDK